MAIDCISSQRAHTQVDYVVLETGLGGRYAQHTPRRPLMARGVTHNLCCERRWDTTNVIEGSRLKVSIITSISKDHQEVLGDTLAQIAWEKVSRARALSLSLLSVAGL